jgi:hypothetical protein
MYDQLDNAHLQQIAVSRVSYRIAVFAVFLVGLAAYRSLRAFSAAKVVSAGPPAHGHSTCVGVKGDRTGYG